MDLITLFFLLFPLSTLLLFTKLKLRSSSHRLPPSPLALPIIGHLHLLMMTSMPHHYLARLATQLGPIIYLKLGRVNSVVVSSPKLAREVLKTHDSVFASRPNLLSSQYLSFNSSDVTFSPSGPYWRQARRICVTELLSPRRVNSFQLIRDQEVDRLLQWITAEAPRSNGIDMSARFFALANDVLCRVAFGRRFSEQGSRLPEVLMETQRLFAGFDVGEFFPELGWVNSVTGLKRRLERNLADLRAVCDEIIKEHEGRGEDNESRLEREDFVDVLLRVQKSKDLEVPLTDDNLKALVLDMFVAGTDTTSATLEWVMTELARHPRVLKKAQEEVRGIAKRKQRVEDHDIHQLQYMKAVIKETLRLHPPVPLLVPRESLSDCIVDGFEIPAKTRVLVNAHAIGRDPRSWDNPLEFRPERFEDSEVDVRGQQDFKLLPFGGGRRGCPGYSFALATIETALARLLYHFDWELPAGVDASCVDMSEVFGLATRKRTPLVLVATNNEAGFEFKG